MRVLPIYVLDTHALVWFLKRNRNIGSRALEVLLASRSQLVAPIYLIDEIRLKSLNGGAVYKNDRIALPPATVLRVLLSSHNIKVFPRSPAVVFEEEKLNRAIRFRQLELDKQDVPICATALAIQNVVAGGVPVNLITNDSKIRKWGKIPLIWN